MKFIQPNEYVLKQVLLHPTLFKSASYNGTVFLILDNLLNISGSGFPTVTSVKQELSNLEFDRNLATKFLSTDVIYYFRYEYEDGSVSNRIYITDESEKSLYPNVPDSVWTKVSFTTLQDNMPTKYIPFPNFSEQSVIYDENFKDLGLNWVIAAYWFYNKCDEFFKDTKNLIIYRDQWKLSAIQEKNILNGVKNALKYLDMLYDDIQGCNIRRLNAWDYILPDEFDSILSSFSISKQQLKVCNNDTVFNKLINYEVEESLLTQYNLCNSYLACDSLDVLYNSYLIKNKITNEYCAFVFKHHYILAFKETDDDFILIEFDAYDNDTSNNIYLTAKNIQVILPNGYDYLNNINEGK